MKVVNHTSFSFGVVPSRLNYPGHSLTLVVKAIIRLFPGSTAAPHEAQCVPDGDAFYSDDVEGTGSLRYDADFAPFKPRADLMLVGSAHAPGGVPTLSLNVTFSVGSTGRTLSVVGDRQLLAGEAEPAPTPFVSMPLKYERAYGGPTNPRNPVGMGLATGALAAMGLGLTQLPNIYDAREVPWFVKELAESAGKASSRPKAPSPAGFGPIRRDWESRAKLLGTYGGTWVKSRFPAPPDDFDPAFFNAAPPELRAEGYLRGDEEIRLRNLHPIIADYRCLLPGLRVRAFRNDLPVPDGPPERRIGTPHEIASRGEFSEVHLNLDTLWVDADTETAVLVWRGLTPVTDEDFEEISHVYLMSEAVGVGPATLADCRRRFLEAIKAEEAAFEPEAPPADAPPPGSAEAKSSKPPLDAAMRAAIEAELAKSDATPEVKARIVATFTGTEADVFNRLRQEVRETRQKAGADPDKPIPLTPEQLAKKRALLTEWGCDPDEIMAAEAMAGEKAMDGPAGEAPPASVPTAMERRADFERSLLAAGFDARARSLALEIYDLPPGPREERLSRDLRVLYRTLGIDPDQPPRLTPQDEQRRAEILRAWGVDAALVQLAERAEEESRAQKRSRVAGRVPLDRAGVLQRMKTGESLHGERLVGLDLSDTDLSGADLEEADLQGANLRGATMAGCRLARANLAGADGSGANLSGVNAGGADFTGSVLDRALLADADLTGAILIDAKLRGATLARATADNASLLRCDATGVIAKEASFAGADFTDALLPGADLDGADLSRAALIRANLRGATMTNTRLADADATEANFSKAGIKGLRASGQTMLARAVLREAHGEGTVWRGCDLRGADLRFVSLPGADFSRAVLDEADLTAANLPGANFRKAKVRRAKLITMNLFNGSLEKADLAGADLTGSNLYGVEFLDAKTADAIGEDVNVKMTKLAKACTDDRRTPIQPAGSPLGRGVSS